jgi:ATP-dependent DNA helicase RecG
MAMAVARGEQAALMAPTEILARQHYQTLLPLAEAAGLRLALHTGSIKGRERTQVLDAIGSGWAQIIIGTHALFQNKVEFNNLGCAIIDEQHRFGVQQRVELSNKGRGCDVLVMTATPIPRSLALTYYGDMEVSKLDEKPPGRQPINASINPVTDLFSPEYLSALPPGGRTRPGQGSATQRSTQNQPAASQPFQSGRDPLLAFRKSAF